MSKKVIAENAESILSLVISAPFETAAIVAITFMFFSTLFFLNRPNRINITHHHHSNSDNTEKNKSRSRDNAE